MDTEEEVIAATSDDSESTSETTKSSGIDIRAALEAAAEEHGYGDDEGDDSEGSDKTPDSAVAGHRTDTKNTPSPKVASLAGTETKVEPVAAPQFWKSEDKALFAKATPEVQQAVLRYEAQRNAWAEKAYQGARAAVEKTKAIDEIFKPLRQELDLNHINDVDAVKRMVTWQRYLQDPETRVDTARRFLATLGIEPSHLMEVEQAGGYDPQLEALQQELAETKEKMQQFEQSHVGAQQQAFVSTVQSWKNQVDGNGQLLRPHVDLFMHQVAQIGESLMQQFPDRPINDILDAAYGYVMQQAEKQLVEPKLGSLQQQNQQRVNVARRAGSSVVSSPSNSVSPNKPKNIRDAIEIATRMHS